MPRVNRTGVHALAHVRAEDDGGTVLCCVGVSEDGCTTVELCSKLLVVNRTAHVLQLKSSCEARLDEGLLAKGAVCVPPGESVFMPCSAWHGADSQEQLHFRRLGGRPGSGVQQAAPGTTACIRTTRTNREFPPSESPEI